MYQWQKNTLWIAFGITCWLQAAPIPAEPEPSRPSPISTFEIPPVRVVWTSTDGVENPQSLLAQVPLQPTLAPQISPCILSIADQPGGILLDFGREIQGHLELATPMTPDKQPTPVRVRFGESAAEAMAEIAQKGSQNDHAVRDQTVLLPWLGTKTVGPSGFRFVRLDAVDPNRPVQLTRVVAQLGVRDIRQQGSFQCSDERLNKIWQTGAHTVHLCMQDYLWDGIKRDRLVWVGDMHPEVSTINAVFGFNDVIPASLDLIRDATPPSQWMNGISSYSMWWVLIHEELWLHHGNIDYLRAQQPYLRVLLRRLAALIGPDGRERIDGMRFLDWPSSPNQKGVTAGLQALLIMSLESGGRLLEACGDDKEAALCYVAAQRGRRHVPDANGSKSGAALLALAGLRPASLVADDILIPGGASGVSTFYGYYVLEALAKAGKTDEAISVIRDYWGGMLDLGATTFWEDFNLEWATNAARIDELVPDGKADVHGDFGDYCYKGYRHSLCHGWASGPTAWLSRHILGVRPLSPGCSRVAVNPRLGSLQWAEGDYPTPKGPIHVRHERQPDGSIDSQIDAPDKIEIILSDSPATQARSAPFEAHSLRCEWLEAPLGIMSPAPRLSWEIEAKTRAFQQQAYQIFVASSPELLAKDKADLWDSGRVVSAETTGIIYHGKKLQSNQDVYWKVQIWSSDDTVSGWSKTATWTMGLLAADAWVAEWISPPDATRVHEDPKTIHLPPAHYYRKEFLLRKPIKRAVLHGSALGLVEWSLDGQPVSNNLFEPGWTDYRKRVPARSHDVSAMFTKGGEQKHCLAATVADGWYAGYVGYGLLVGRGPHQTGRAIYGCTPAILCQLEIEYTDGSKEAICSDTTWQVTTSGPIREADFLMGETYDAQQEMPGWDTAGYTVDPVRWQTVAAAAASGSITAPFFEPGVEREVELGFVPPAHIDSYAAPPIQVTEELKAQSVVEWEPGVFLFDMGQNFAGVVRLQVQAAAGTRIQLRFGEMRHPDGRLMTENLRRARATDTYICKGEGVESWTPRFTYHGFQFVELTGLPAGVLPPLDTVTGLVVHNATRLTGQFACSDPVMTQFWKNTQWTQRANFIEVPTDCPQRDERLGWMGDAQIYARTATFNADVAAFFTKWIADVREAQVQEGPDAGAYPDYAPYPFAHGKPGAVYGTAWTDAGVICPWTMWRVYGDTMLLEQHWDSMTRFMDWRARRDPSLKGLETGNTWGDWLNVNEATPLALIDLCYHAQSARMMAEMAEALSHKTSAQHYRDRFTKITQAFRQQYLRPDGTLTIETQTACVLALAMSMLKDNQTKSVAGQLASRIEAADFHMTTGFLGTKSILPVLSENGHHNLACRLFQSREFPSWGYEVEQGANTVWERWDSFTKENGFDGATGKNNAAMNSFSHYAFGAVMEWAYRTLAGIDELEPGYRRIRIRPLIPSATSNPVGDPITWVKADYQSPCGLIRSHWQVDGSILSMRITVPANTLAEVHLPCVTTDEFFIDGKPFAESLSRLRLLQNTGATAVLEVGSGDYTLRSRMH